MNNYGLTAFDCGTIYCLFCDGIGLLKVRFGDFCPVAGIYDYFLVVRAGGIACVAFDDIDLFSVCLCNHLLKQHFLCYVEWSENCD